MPESKDSFFLPDFCSIQMVFAVVIIGELLAFVLTLTPLDSSSERWNDLAFISLFIQWQGLTISAVLCFLRKHLSQVNSVLAVSLIVIAILMTIALMSEIAFLIQNQFSLGLIASDISNVEFISHSLLIGGVISLLALRYFYVKHQLVKQIQAESEARLQALQWRIRPHFLFNSMNTIVSLIRKQPLVAEQLLENFAELFRYVLKEKPPLVNIQEELELLKNYLQIEQLRLDERLKITWSIEALPLDAAIPVLTLQPLVENAIYHGIETSISGGTLTIEGALEQGFINISIRNPWQDRESAHRHRKGNHIAMENIRRRLQLHFSSQSSLELHKRECECQLKLRFPYQALSQ